MPRKRHRHRHRQSPPPSSPPPPATFPSHKTTPNLPPNTKYLCDIISNTPPQHIHQTLIDTNILVTTTVVEQVLKLTYSHPSNAVKFFRWAGYQLNDQHSPYSWNLIIDMLGKNCLFDAMWDAIGSMWKEGFLSLATFGSVFTSYIGCGRVDGAISAFERMGEFGCLPNVVALNSLFSAICREGRTKEARDYLKIVRVRTKPDGDTYAILLEGWESEKDGGSAKQTFVEMVREIGWVRENVGAYDSFLCTMLKGKGGLKEAMEFFDDLGVRKCYPGVRFFKSALNECVLKGDVKSGETLWDVMTKENVCQVDTEIYNTMISLYCCVEDFGMARKLLDEMVFNGVFPDEKIYNVLLRFLIKKKKLTEANLIFCEMVKNEFVPAHANSCIAVKVFVDGGDPYTAIKVWKCMIEDYKTGIEETGNVLVGGLLNLNRVPEAVKYAEDMIDRRIKVTSDTLSRLKQSLVKAGKGSVHDELLKKWKLHYAR